MEVDLVKLQYLPKITYKCYLVCEHKDILYNAKNKISHKNTKMRKTFPRA